MKTISMKLLDDPFILEQNYDPLSSLSSTSNSDPSLTPSPKSVLKSHSPQATKEKLSLTSPKST